jgi:hypothetical protein
MARNDAHILRGQMHYKVVFRESNAMTPIKANVHQRDSKKQNEIAIFLLFQC